MRTPHLLALTLAVATSARPARAEVPDPVVHAAATRLDAARATVYKARALDLYVDTQSLLSSNAGRADPPVGEGWEIRHPAGHEVDLENVAEQLHRAHELEAYEHSVGPTAMYVGAVGFGASAVAAGIFATAGAAGNFQYGTNTAGFGIIGPTAFASLVTFFIGWAVHANSDRMVPLSIATDLVSEYNATIADDLGGRASSAAAPSDAPLAVVPGSSLAGSPDPALAVVPTEPQPLPADPVVAVEAAPETDASPSRDRGPVSRHVSLGVKLIESDGVRIANVDHARARELYDGDLVVALDDIPMPTLKAVRAYLARLRRGDVVAVRVRRAGAERNVTVRL